LEDERIIKAQPRLDKAILSAREKGHIEIVDLLMGAVKTAVEHIRLITVFLVLVSTVILYFEKCSRFLMGLKILKNIR